MIIECVPDPAQPLTVQGEQMRSLALASSLSMDVDATWQVPAWAPSIVGDDVARSQGDLVAGDQTLVSMTGMAAGDRVARAGSSLKAGGVIVTPAGGPLIPFNPGAMCCFVSPFVEDSSTFAITGTTRTGTGATLGNCAVVVLETGRISQCQAPVAAMGTSDGAGAFSLAVPTNTAYQLTGYLSGSPDKAGITKNTVVPGTVDIYLRDPTAADTGGGGTVVYTFVG